MPKITERKKTYEEKSLTLYATTSLDTGRLLTERMPVTVKGTQVGNLFVHLKWQMDEKTLKLEIGNVYVVTQLPTGFTTGSHTKTRDDSLKIAELMVDTLPSLKETTAEKVVRGFPRWVKPWLQKISQLKQWVDPAEFQQQYPEITLEALKPKRIL